MLKVILVDDEEIIRNGIQQSLDWNSLGFEIVGTAEDGEEALSTIAVTKPNLVITDIKMPFMDGLELIERVRTDYPEIYFIIISGHDEFPLAQRALQLGAYDYILKPIDLAYLESLLQKITADYRQRQKKAAQIASLEEKVSSQEPLLKEIFFQNLLEGKVTPEELTAKLQEYKDLTPDAFFSVIIVQIDDYYLITQEQEETECRVIDEAFTAVIRNSCDNANVYVVRGHHHYEKHLICSAGDEKLLTEVVANTCANLHQQSSEFEKLSLSLAVSQIHQGINSLSKAYKEAAEALNYKYILGKKQVLFFNELNKLHPKKPQGFSYDESGIIVAVKTGDQTGLEHYLEDLKAKLNEQGKNSQLFLQIVVSNIFVQILKMLKESGGEAEEVFNDPLNTCAKILGNQTAAGALAELRQALDKVATYLSIKRNNKFSQILEKAKEYIRNNYAREDLSLDEVARSIGISPCYFSFLFKQEYGINYIEYLNKIRLEKAKELLTISDAKSYEVAYLVGFNNPTYFSMLFKKYHGVSPSEYKNSLR